MDLTKGIDNAHFTIRVTEKKVTDIFDYSGKIATMQLSLKELNASFKINICGKELTEKDFNIRSEYSWQLSQTSVLGDLKGHRNEIEFKDGGVFEIEQDSVNVWRIMIWVARTEKKQESNKSFFE